MNSYFDILPHEVTVIILLKATETRSTYYTSRGKVLHVNNVKDIVMSRIFEAVLKTPNFWISKMERVIPELDIKMIKSLRPDFWNTNVDVGSKYYAFEMLLYVYMERMSGLNYYGSLMYKLCLLKASKVAVLPDGEFKTYLQGMYDSHNGKLRPEFYNCQMETYVKGNMFKVKIYVIDKDVLRLIRILKITRKEMLCLSLCFAIF